MNEYLATIQLGKSNKSLSLEVYQGKFSLVSTWEGQDGSIKPNWVFRQERENGENVPGKAIPLKLQLGDDRMQAIGLLKQLINALSEGGGIGKPDQTMTRRPVDDEQIPF